MVLIMTTHGNFILHLLKLVMKGKLLNLPNINRFSCQALLSEMWWQTAFDTSET